MLLRIKWLNPVSDVDLKRKKDITTTEYLAIREGKKFFFIKFVFFRVFYDSQKIT